MVASNELTPGSGDAVSGSSGDALFGGAVRPGQVIGEFELREVIGRGGMGTVYKAWQRSLRRLVALKVLAPHIAGSRASIARFQREAQAAAKLHHPHIVPIFALGEESSTYYYAMELIEGQSLSDLIREERQKLGYEASDEDLDATRVLPRTSSGVSSSARAGSLAASDTGVILAGSDMHLPTGGRYERITEHLARIADALDYAHQQGVVHRDIKPHNLILSRDGRLLITDFGLARVLEQPGITMTSEVVGSPLYMAPEQIRGDGVVDQRCDVYSLAATMFEWLTLQPPFSGKTRETVITQILTGEMREPRSINPAIPSDLETICLKGLEREAHRRYASAGDFRDDLRAFLSAGRIRATRIGLVERTRRFVNRNRAGAALIGLAMLALVSVLVIWRQNSTIRRMETRQEARRDAGPRENGPRPPGARPQPPPGGDGPPPPPDGAAGEVGSAPVDPLGKLIAGLFPAESKVFEVAKDIADKNAPALAEQASGLAEHASGLTQPLISVLGFGAVGLEFGTVQSLCRAASVEIFRNAGPLSEVLFMVDPTDMDRRSETLIDALQSTNPTFDINVLTNVLLTQDASDAAALYVRAVLYGKTGNYELMAADATALIAARPSDPYALLVRGLAALMAGSTEAAQSDIRAAIELQHDLHVAHALKGLADIRGNDAESALKSFETAMDLAPDSALCRVGHALAQARRREHSAAMEELTKVLDEDPKNVDALVIRGDCEREMGRLEDALQDYQKAAVVSGGNAALLAKFFQTQADREKANGQAGASVPSTSEVSAPGSAGAPKTRSLDSTPRPSLGGRADDHGVWLITR
ncbi:MAG: protein kinase [Phycisphaerales bacterium]|nr:protein kinase [Phycisphaerales bacterium]